MSRVAAYRVKVRTFKSNDFKSVTVLAVSLTDLEMLVTKAFPRCRVMEVSCSDTTVITTEAKRHFVERAAEIVPEDDE